MKLKDLFKDYPVRLGKPESFVTELSPDEPVLIRGDPSLTEEDLEAVLEADASYFPKTGVEGTAWRLCREGRAYKMQARSRRYGKGPNVAEMRAVILGMKDAQKKGVRSLLIKTDSSWSAHVLAGLWKAKQPHTIAIAKEALSLVEDFEAVALVHTRTKNVAQVDRAARQAAEKKGKAVEKKLAERLQTIERVLERAEDVHLDRAGDGWIAEGRFAVNVDPPRCSCPGWTLRWQSVPLAGKRANRNPCKHLAAAAREEGIRDPGGLLALTRRAQG